MSAYNTPRWEFWWFWIIAVYSPHYLRWIVTVTAVLTMAIADTVLCTLEPLKIFLKFSSSIFYILWLPCVFTKCPLVLQNRKAWLALSVLFLLYNWLISFLCILFTNRIINLFYLVLNGKICPLCFWSSFHSLILPLDFFFFFLAWFPKACTCTLFLRRCLYTLIFQFIMACNSLTNFI